MSSSNLTIHDVIDGLIEEDEDAIAHHFGEPWPDLAVGNAPKFGRALIFIVKRREGATDDEARQAVRSLTKKECDEFFAAESSDEEAGKDESPDSATDPEPSSVS